MKKLKILFIIYFFIGFLNAFSQEIKEIDSILKIENFKHFSKELRVYIFESFSENCMFYRIYQNELNQWKIEEYFVHPELESLTYINENDFLNDSIIKKSYKPERFTKKNIKPNKNFDFEWLNLLTTNILEIPDLSEYEYKLNKKSVEKINGKYEIIEEEVIGITDGKTYIIKIKNEENLNELILHNPYSYIKFYPEVDELNYLSNFLTKFKDIFY
ncbi:hypothetical protein [Wenyingzhuangia sp. IMCC45467]